jgi:DNA modification methylase
MNPKATILIGDCREQMRSLPANSVHCVVTSPPYFALRTYLPDDDPAKGLEIGAEKTVAEFLNTMVAVFEEVWRVLRPDGTVWMNLGDTYWNGGGVKRHNGMNHVSGGQKQLQKMNGMILSSKLHDSILKPKDLIGIPWKTAFALQEAGWYLRSEIIWHKPNPVPEPDRGRPTMSHETLFLLTKSKNYFYDNDAIREPTGNEPTMDEYMASLGSNTGADANREMKGYKKCSHEMTHPDGRQKRSVWTIPTKGFPGSHYATFPPALVEPCILAGTSERGACSECGAQQKRVTEMSEAYAAKLGKGWHDHKDDDKVGQRGTPAAFRGAPSRMTVGWKAQCECNAGFVPSTVLDPFGGTGTVGEVAMRYGRDAVLIDIDSRNEAFMRERTAQQKLNLIGG